MTVTAAAALFGCPSCHHELVDEGTGHVCSGCGVGYPTRGTQPDLRPASDLVRTLRLRFEPEHETPTSTVRPLDPGPWAELDVPPDAEYCRGNRLTPRLTTHLPPARGGDLLLDVGCGDAVLGRYLAAERGYGYVGIDVEAPEATVLADAHCLPFASSSFPVVASFAVLEHVRVPHLVAQELHRVLEPGGPVLGSVAFLEPYHMESYFHHTHLGLAEVLEAAGFEDIRIEANSDWVATDALFEMHSAGVIPGGGRMAPVATAILRGLAATPRFLGQRLADVTGGFRFVARKPLE